MLYSRSFHVGSFFVEAVSIDLILTAPILYLLAARKFRARAALVFPLMAIGLALSNFLLPAETATMRWFAKVMLPALELITIGSISFYAYRFYQLARRNRDTDALTIIRKSCEKLFGKNVIAAVLTTEFAVVYYGFIASRKPFHHHGFSSYKDNGVLVVYGFLAFIIGVETFIFHFLLIQWHVLTAWIISGFSVYVALQIFAHARAMAIRRIEVGDELKIRYGLAADVNVPFDQIEAIDPSSETVGELVKPITIGLLKSLEPHSVIIRLKMEIEAHSFYGRKKAGRTILLPVDDKANFIALINAKIQR